MSHDLKTLANPFQFTDLDIRAAIDEHSEVRFCAKDVCAVFDIAWKGSTETLKTCRKLDGAPETPAPCGGEKDAVFINEAGLYHLIFRSNKSKAKEFANWVCETVLPEIRKTGFFGTLEIKDQIGISKQINSISLQIAQTTNAFRRKQLHDQLRRIFATWLIIRYRPPTGSNWNGQAKLGVIGSTGTSMFRANCRRLRAATILSLHVLTASLLRQYPFHE
ncbi:MAG: BRO-N domain-containing protein [Gammaproteobacteria bacterium]